MKQLLESGVHFGHQARRWNPKMKRFIFMERNGIHIIDLQQTLVRVEEGYAFVRDLATSGGQLLFVGTKKDAQRLEDELEHLDRYFAGVREMKRLPSALFVVDPHREHIAVDEARRLEIPVVAMVDTNCDPDLIDVIIPANDDAIRAVKLICQKMADAVIEGRSIFDAARKEATPEDMGYAPTTTTAEIEGGVGVPRAKRTPRVYEPEEEDEYPIGGAAETEKTAEEF